MEPVEGLGDNNKNMYEVGNIDRKHGKKLWDPNGKLARQIASFISDNIMLDTSLVISDIR